VTGEWQKVIFSTADVLNNLKKQNFHAIETLLNSLKSMQMPEAQRNIVCSSDVNYLPHLGTMLRTLADHNDPKLFNIYLVYADNPCSKLQKFVNFVENIGFKVALVPVDSTSFEGFPIHGHVTTASYYRLALPLLLPESINTALFLDCDLCVTGDISYLWNIDISSHLVAAVESPDDPIGDKERLQMGLSDKYFNAGVMLLNMHALRSFDLLEKSKHFLANNREKILWWDQDVLNALLHSKALILNPVWNYLPLHSESQLFPLQETDVKVVHFSGGGSRKPWDYRCTNNFKNAYRRARARTPWKKYKLDNRPSFRAKILGIFANIIRKSQPKLETR
jgi:lipopolysaccharide biosynthesis glycosyltransferase